METPSTGSTTQRSCRSLPWTRPRSSPRSTSTSCWRPPCSGSACARACCSSWPGSRSAGGGRRMSRSPMPPPRPGRGHWPRRASRPEQIGLLIDTSVCRARLEPSSAVAVHHELGLPSSCLNFDLSNACLGFVNGMQLAAHDDRLRADRVRADRGRRGQPDRPGAHARIGCCPRTPPRPTCSPTSPRSRSAPVPPGWSWARPTGTRRATCSSAAWGGRPPSTTSSARATWSAWSPTARACCWPASTWPRPTWKDAEADFDWTDVQHYVMHQVSTVHCGAMIQRLGLDADLVPLTFPTARQHRACGDPDHPGHAPGPDRAR